MELLPEELRTSDLLPRLLGFDARGRPKRHCAMGCSPRSSSTVCESHPEAAVTPCEGGFFICKLCQADGKYMSSFHSPNRGQTFPQQGTTFPQQGSSNLVYGETQSENDELS